MMVSGAAKIENTRVSWRVGCWSVTDLEIEFEYTPSFISSKFDPDLLLRYGAIVPCQTVYSIEDFK